MPRPLIALVALVALVALLLTPLAAFADLLPWPLQKRGIAHGDPTDTEIAIGAGIIAVIVAIVGWWWVRRRKRLSMPVQEFQDVEQR